MNILNIFLGKSECLEIDEKENAIDSLNKAVDFLKNTRKDSYNWKWFAIALHHSTYSFMLLSLTKTNLSGIWKSEKRSPEGDIDVEKSELISFMEEFRRIQKLELMKHFVNSKPFKANTRHERAMRYLNDRLRNLFIHYKPVSWAIYYQCFINIVEPILEVIEFLVFESRTFFLDEEKREQIKFNIERIREICKGYKNSKECLI